ncbi:JAB domain-containing protein [Sphingomonas paeninsulae]|uniref:JAB domain-containing protein n=1 Tax=Sphingomonas paeninsulae TaxID=2319844 RepID=UPI001EF13262|nr:DNA repair protein RadC [Sphingomonas paeninsulae]
MGLPGTSCAGAWNEDSSAALARRTVEVRLLASVLRPVVGDDCETSAETLIEEFGSLSDVMATNPILISSAAGRSDIGVAIATIREVLGHILLYRVSDRPIVGCSSQLVDYLRIQMAFESREQLRVLYLNCKNGLIRDEIVSHGSISDTSFEPRDIVRRALQLDAAALIVAHNHPSGDASPSAADIFLTRKLIRSTSAFDIVVHDHIILGRNDVNSLRQLDLI